jgi:hypothetical protein
VSVDREVDRNVLVEGMRANAHQWGADGSPFYETLLLHVADDVAAGGPCWPVLEAHAENPLTEVPGIRLLGGVHRLVLEGRAPELTPYYPSVGGNGDADAVWPAFRELVGRQQVVLTAAVEHVPQTNEVGRSMALAAGWAVVAQETRLPLRIVEPGASAGLNLRSDHYYYRSCDRSWGDPRSPVQFVDRWSPGVPPFDPDVRIVERRGCDRAPIDAGTEDGRLTLLSYVWPDERERFETLRNALDIARGVPVTIDRGDAIEWLAAQLAEPRRGCVTVVYHSYFWQYLDAPTAAAGLDVLEDAGHRATLDAPLARVSLEVQSSGDYSHSELRVRTWPGGEERLLGSCGVHPTTVRWL